MDRIPFGIDFHSIRNRNESRVIEILGGVLDEFPGFVPTRGDVEDIYALALNMLPARYAQAVSLVMPLVCKSLQRERRKKMKEMRLWEKKGKMVA